MCHGTGEFTPYPSSSPGLEDETRTPLGLLVQPRIRSMGAVPKPLGHWINLAGGPWGLSVLLSWHVPSPVQAPRSPGLSSLTSEVGMDVARPGRGGSRVVPGQEGGWLCTSPTCSPHLQIDDGVASLVIAQLLFLQSESNKKPIHMYINSPGEQELLLPFLPSLVLI